MDPPGFRACPVRRPEQTVRACVFGTLVVRNAIC
jgi:hypothetical protein